MKRLLLTILLCLFAFTATASEVTIAWDANPPEEHVTGYEVYWSVESMASATFPGYQNVVDAGNVTEITVTNLPAIRGPIYFTVVAYNGAGLKSDHSDEVFKDFTQEWDANNPPTQVGGARVTGALFGF